MKTTVSILGCGWLGTALGKKLLRNRYVVKGSTHSADRYNQLESTGIQPYFLKVSPDYTDIDYANFFNTDILVISLPPGRTGDVEEVFPKQIGQVIQYIQSIGIKKVLFISSTSVYESKNTEVREGDEGQPEKPSGKALLTAEKMLLELENVQTTILRFSGLIGADRNPARFLARKNEVDGEAPVNLIHRDDCVDIILAVFEKEIWGEVLNACSPGHPTKKDFYSKAARISNLPVPVFSSNSEKFKVVNSDKLIGLLNYRFYYPSPMDYLKELEEWAYRI